MNKQVGNNLTTCVTFLTHSKYDLLYIINIPMGYSTLYALLGIKTYYFISNSTGRFQLVTLKECGVNVASAE